VWVNRRHLLRARERLSSKRFTAMWNACIGLDPSGDLLATCIAKEELRALLGCAKTDDRHTIRARLFDFYTWCADTDVPEVHTLAGLIEIWWPAVLTFLQTGATNAATEGTNRLIKQVKRLSVNREGCHFMDQGSVSPVPRPAAATGMTDGAEPGARSQAWCVARPAGAAVCGTSTPIATPQHPGGVVERARTRYPTECSRSGWVPVRPHGGTRGSARRGRRRVRCARPDQCTPRAVSPEGSEPRGRCRGGDDSPGVGPS
jgi:hypothetical protein